MGAYGTDRAAVNRGDEEVVMNYRGGAVCRRGMVDGLDSFEGPVG